jgi:hypothetical protein
MDAARFCARCGSGALAGGPIVGMEVAVNPAVNHPQDRGPAELAGLSRGGVGRALPRRCRPATDTPRQAVIADPGDRDRRPDHFAAPVSGR